MRNGSSAHGDYKKQIIDKLTLIEKVPIGKNKLGSMFKIS